MDIDSIMSRSDQTVPSKIEEIELQRAGLAQSVIDTEWKPDWAMIEADYLSEKVSCKKLAIRYTDGLIDAIKARVRALMELSNPSISEDMLGTNTQYHKDRVVKIMADRITRMQGVGDWTAKRKGRQMRVVAEVVEERIESDIEKIKAMREIERADIERMRITAMRLLDEVTAEGGQQFLFKSDVQDTKANGLEAVSRIYEKIQKMLYKSWDIAEKVETLNKNINSDLSEMPDDVLLEKVQEAAGDC